MGVRGQVSGVGFQVSGTRCQVPGVGRGVKHIYSNWVGDNGFGLVG